MNRVPMLNLRAEYELMRDEIDQAIQTCLEHQRWILGPEVKALEGQIASLLGAEHCVGVASGTDALVLALRSLALARTGQEYFPESAEIITTAFTFVATGDAILRAHAKPVFVDIDPATFNIDVQQAREYLRRNGSRVVGIAPVHLYGRACPMDQITALASEYGLFVLEDTAQAFGASFDGRRLASIGDAGALSFFPSKNLGGFGDGGMIVTSDASLAENARILLKHGGRDKYNVDHIGYNSRLHTLQAAVLLAKLRHVESFNARRRALAAAYGQALADVEGITVPDIPEGHVVHQYTLRVSGGKRDELKDFLNSHGVDSMVYYPIPLTRMKVFDGRAVVFSPKGDGSLPEAERAAQEVLSLPIEPLQDAAATQTVTKAVREFSAVAFH